MSASTTTAPTAPSASAPTSDRASRRIRVLRRIGIVAVLLVPLAVAGFSIAAFADPLAGASRVPVALVDDDQMITQTAADGTQTPVLAGRALVTQLTAPDSAASLDWQLSNDAQAAKLLADGDVYAIVTIPSDFSADILSTQGADPQQALVQIRTDDAHSYLASAISGALGQSMTSAFGTGVTEQFITNAFQQVGDSFTSAADGASQLSDGAASTASGARSYASGVSSYVSGVSQLSRGAQSLSSGSKSLTQLVTGTQQYTGGVSQISAQLTQVSAALQADPTNATLLAQLAGLTGALQQAAAGGPQLVSGTQSAVSGIRSGISQLADGASQLSDNGSTLVAGARQLANGVAQLSTGADSLASGLAKGADEFAGSSDQPSALAQVAANPVGYQLSTENPISGTSQALATFLIPLALWIGALVAFLVLQPLSRRMLASSAGSGRLLLSALSRAAAVTGAQAVLLVALLHVALGVSWTLLPQTFFFSLLVAAAFTAFHAALALGFGRPGLIGSFVLLAVQFAAAGLIVPVQLLTQPFGAISPYLPLSWASNGLQQILTGGSGADVLGASVALLLFGAASVAVAAFVLRRTRRVAALGLLPASA